MRPPFKTAGAIVAILAAGLLAAPVLAGEWTVIRQTGTVAYAFDGTCTDNPDGTTSCDGQSIDVFEGRLRLPGEPTRRGERVCYSEYSQTFDSSSGAFVAHHALFGCAFDAGTLDADKLSLIELEPTVVELTALECDASLCTESPAGSTIVEGRWTGVGPISSQKSKYRFDDGSCIQVNADKGSQRAATFVGSIASSDALMIEGTFTFRTTCPF
jgi:hypothetical protein